MKTNYYLPEVDTMHLLDKKEMKKPFPDAEMYYERLFGMTKSLVAWKV